MNERAEVTYFVEEEPRLRETISAFITSRKMRRGPGALHSRDHLGILLARSAFGLLSAFFENVFAIASA
jgi:hypothetical protein